MKINQMEKTTNNQINQQEEIRILSRITPVPDICDHQNVEGQNGYFSLKKGWFVFLTFVFMNHTVQLSQTSQSSFSAVFDNIVGAFLEKLDGGEALDFGVFQFVESRVHLGDHNGIIILEFLTEFIVNGRQLFAVTAPGSVEFDQNILGLVESDFIKIGRNQHLDRVFVPIFRQIFGEQVRFHFAFKEIRNERFHDVSSQVSTGWFVLGHIVFQMDQTHGWKLILLHAEEFQDTLVVIFIGVNSYEQNLSFEFFGNGLSFGVDFATISVAFTDEDKQMVLDITTEDLLSALVVELDHKRQRFCLDERHHSGRSDLTVHNHFPC